MTVVHTARVVGTTADIVRIHAVRDPAVSDVQVTHDGSEQAAREIAVRVRCALDARLDARLPVAVTIEGRASAACDLAVALAVQAARDGAPAPAGLYVGELDLSGRLRPVRGVLPMLLAAGDLPYAVVPEGNRVEAETAARVVRIPIHCARTLLDAGFGPKLPRVGEGDIPPSSPYAEAWEEVAHLPQAAKIRALVEAGKPILLVGPPGSGKTMVGRRVRTLLGEPTAAEQLEIATVASAAGLGIPASRPFRAPHHTVSAGALVGGGDPVRPGEVTLAHGGVLFLDEVTELRRDALEQLAQAVREGEQGAVRREGGEYRTHWMPAKPSAVIAACNPCPCGRGPADAKGRCTCSAELRKAYEARIARVVELFGFERVDLEYVPARRASVGG